MYYTDCFDKKEYSSHNSQQTELRDSQKWNCFFKQGPSDNNKHVCLFSNKINDIHNKYIPIYFLITKQNYF